MEEPGLGTDVQNPRISPHLPNPTERMARMLWPRLPPGGCVIHSANSKMGGGNGKRS